MLRDQRERAQQPGRHAAPDRGFEQQKRERQVQREMEIDRVERPGVHDEDGGAQRQEQHQANGCRIIEEHRGQTAHQQERGDPEQRVEQPGHPRHDKGREQQCEARPVAGDDGTGQRIHPVKPASKGEWDRAIEGKEGHLPAPLPLGKGPGLEHRRRLVEAERVGVIDDQRSEGVDDTGQGDRQR